MNKKLMAAFGSVAVMGLVTEAVRDRPDPVQAEEKERVAIGERCTKYAIEKDGGDYGWHTGEKIEACCAHHLSVSFFPNNNREGNELWNLILKTSGRTPEQILGWQ